VLQLVFYFCYLACSDGIWIASNGAQRGIGLVLLCIFCCCKKGESMYYSNTGVIHKSMIIDYLEYTFKSSIRDPRSLTNPERTGSRASRT
jgi:hypothetical protein